MAPSNSTGRSLRGHTDPAMSAAVDAAPAPTPDDKARYDAAKKDLMHALAKKRVVDKHLVRPRSATLLLLCAH